MAEIVLNAVIRGQTVPGDNLSLLAFVLQEQHLLAPFSSQSRISLDVRPTRFLFDPPASNSKARCYFKTTWMIPLLVAHLLILHILFFLSFFSFFSRPIQQLSAPLGRQLFFCCCKNRSTLQPRTLLALPIFLNAKENILPKSQCSWNMAVRRRNIRNIYWFRRRQLRFIYHAS